MMCIRTLRSFAATTVCIATTYTRETHSMSADAVEGYMAYKQADFIMQSP